MKTKENKRMLCVFRRTPTRSPEGEVVGEVVIYQGAWGPERQTCLLPPHLTCALTYPQMRNRQVQKHAHVHTARAKQHCAVWVFHAKHFIETNNSRGRNKLRGVIGKRENICFQLQFKMKCSVDKIENTAGRTFLTEESAQAALTS